MCRSDKNDFYTYAVVLETAKIPLKTSIHDSNSVQDGFFYEYQGEKTAIINITYTKTAHRNNPAGCFIVNVFEGCISMTDHHLAAGSLVATF